MKSILALAVAHWSVISILVLLGASGCSSGATIVTPSASRNVTEIPANCVLAWHDGSDIAADNTIRVRLDNGKELHDELALVRIGVTEAFGRSLLDHSRLGANVFETLVGIDCNGTLVPRLAVSWESRDDIRWRFKLRDSIILSNATAVTAPRLADFLDERLGADAVDSVSVVDGRTIEFVLTNAKPNFPEMLTDQRFAYSFHSMGNSSFSNPVGSGAFEISTMQATETGRDTLALREHSAEHLLSNAAMKIVVHDVSSGPDLRDLLLDSLAVLVTRRHTAVDYGRRSRNHSVAALPPDRQYLMIAPSRFEVLAMGNTLPPLPSLVTTEDLNSLSNDVLRGHARPITEPGTGGAILPRAEFECDFSNGSGDGRKARLNRPDKTAHRILFDRADPVAKDIAERISVVIASRDGNGANSNEITAAVPGLRSDVGGLQVVGVSQIELEQSLAFGSDLLYVVSQPTGSLNHCSRFVEFVANANRTSTRESRNWSLGHAELYSLYQQSSMPLVETWEYAVLVKNRFRIAVDGRGNLVFLGNDVVKVEEAGADQ